MVETTATVSRITASIRNGIQSINIAFNGISQGTTNRHTTQGGEVTLKYYSLTFQPVEVDIRLNNVITQYLRWNQGGGLEYVSLYLPYSAGLILALKTMYRMDTRGTFSRPFEVKPLQNLLIKSATGTSIVTETVDQFYNRSMLNAVITRSSPTAVVFTYVSNYPSNPPQLMVHQVNNMPSDEIPTTNNVIIHGTRSLGFTIEATDERLVLYIGSIGSFNPNIRARNFGLIPAFVTPPPIIPDDPAPDTPDTASITIGIELVRYEAGMLVITGRVHPHLPQGDNITIRIYRKYDTQTEYALVATIQNPNLVNTNRFLFANETKGNIYATIQNGNTVLATSNTIPLRIAASEIVALADINTINLLEKMPIQFIKPTHSGVRVRIQSELLLLDEVIFVTAYFTNGTVSKRGQISVPNQFDFIEFGVDELLPLTKYAVRVVVRYKRIDYDTHFLEFTTLAAMAINPTPEQIQERVIDQLLVQKLPQDDALPILNLSLTQKELIAGGIITAQVNATSEDIAADQNKKNRRTRYGQVQGDSAFAKDAPNEQLSTFADSIEDLPTPNEDDNGDFEV